MSTQPVDPAVQAFFRGEDAEASASQRRGEFEVPDLTGEALLKVVHELLAEQRTTNNLLRENNRLLERLPRDMRDATKAVVARAEARRQ